MSEQQFFVKLRDILAYLYSEDDDARRVVNDAGMDSRNIAFSTKAINNWTAILLQAQKENKTADLMAITFKDYKENEKLSKVWDDYLVTLRNQEVSLLPDATSNRNTRWSWGWFGLIVAILISIGILLQRSSFTFSNLIFPHDVAANNSSIFQPTSTIIISPTKTKSATIFTAIPKATKTSLSFEDVPASSYNNTPTMTQVLTSNISEMSAVTQQDMLTTTISRTISLNEPTTDMGILEVKQSEGCRKSYWGYYGYFEILDLDGQVIGKGQPGGESFIAAGTYNIVLHVSIGEPLLKQNVVIRKNEKTILDFSGELSTLLIKEHPKLKYELGYRVYKNDKRVSDSSLRIGEAFCIVPGSYSIKLFDNLYTFPRSDKAKWDINIKAGENFIVEPKVWAKLVGLLSTSVETVNIEANVTDLQTSEQSNYYLSTHAWEPIGRYKILTKGQPYIGLKFEVEIKAGEETILPLPTEQLNVTPIEEKLPLSTTLTPTSTISPTGTIALKVAQKPNDASVFTTAAPLSSTPLPDQILFYTDFKKATNLDWIVGKNLALVDNRLASKGGFQANIGDMSWKNYRITLSRVSFSGHYSFFVRMQDKSNFMEIRCDGTPNQSGVDICYWFKIINGQEQIVPGDFFRTDKYNIIQVEIQGQTYRFIVDGKEVSKIVDLQHSFDNGSVSILSDDVIMLGSIEVVSLP
ncbi:MAG: effector-associated domain EAD1-containing protein [Caldilineaceae bacterium]